MSEFGEMIREAFLGLESFDALPGKAELERAIAKLDRRERTVRWMAWGAVAFMTALVVGVLVSWFRADGHGVESAATHVALFLFAMSGIGMMKLWLIVMQSHFTTLQELKRTQLLTLERAAAG